MRGSTFGLLIFAVALSGCDRQDTMSGASPKSLGRYAGIGTYEPGRLWAQNAGAIAAKEPASANLDDDDQIVVVVDSHTGEVRQCGNHSGFCVATNPWSAEALQSGTPVKLKKHHADLE